MCKIYTQLVFIEKIPEEDQVIRQGTAPVIPIVGAGPFRILVGNFEGKHFLMQPSVAPDENIVDPAVEYYFQLCAGIFFRPAQYGQVLPVPRITDRIAYPFGQFKPVPYFFEVNPAAHTPGSAKGIWMPQGKEQGAVAAHAEPGNGPVVLIGNGTVVPVNVAHHVNADICFVAVIFINRAVEIPAAHCSVRANNDGLIRVCMVL